MIFTFDAQFKFPAGDQDSLKIKRGQLSGTTYPFLPSLEPAARDKLEKILAHSFLRIKAIFKAFQPSP
jgi:hypothetical protein